jgi:hypothetical protein
VYWKLIIGVRIKQNQLQFRVLALWTSRFCKVFRCVHNTVYLAPGVLQCITFHTTKYTFQLLHASVSTESADGSAVNCVTAYTIHTELLHPVNLLKPSCNFTYRQV